MKCFKCGGHSSFIVSGQSACVSHLLDLIAHNVGPILNVYEAGTCEKHGLPRLRCDGCTDEHSRIVHGTLNQNDIVTLDAVINKGIQHSEGCMFENAPDQFQCDCSSEPLRLRLRNMRARLAAVLFVDRT